MEENNGNKANKENNNTNNSKEKSKLWGKNLVENIVNDLKGLLIALIVLLVIFKIVFYKESLLVIVKLILSMFWLFIIPGFFWLWLWQRDMDFLERLVTGTALGIATTSVISYFFGLAGVPLMLYLLLIPALQLLVIAVLLYQKFNVSNN